MYRHRISYLTYTHSFVFREGIDPSPSRVYPSNNSLCEGEWNISSVLHALLAESVTYVESSSLI